MNQSFLLPLTFPLTTLPPKTMRKKKKNPALSLSLSLFDFGILASPRENMHSVSEIDEV